MIDEIGEIRGTLRVTPKQGLPTISADRTTTNTILVCTDMQG